MSETTTPIGVPSGDNVFPVLPLRDIVVFPHMIVPLFVGREKSIKALEEVMSADKQILLATQKDASDDDPSPVKKQTEPQYVLLPAVGGATLSVSF